MNPAACASAVSGAVVSPFCRSTSTDFVAAFAGVVATAAATAEIPAAADTVTTTGTSEVPAITTGATATATTRRARLRPAASLLARR